jgi:hypothetical protein
MGGFRIQWGKKTQSGYGDSTSMSFPNNCYGVWASTEITANLQTHSIGSISSTSFQVNADYWSGAVWVNTAATFWWLAIGN